MTTQQQSAPYDASQYGGNYYTQAGAAGSSYPGYDSSQAAYSGYGYPGYGYGQGYGAYPGYYGTQPPASAPVTTSASDSTNTSATADTTGSTYTSQAPPSDDAAPSDVKPPSIPVIQELGNASLRGGFMAAGRGPRGFAPPHHVIRPPRGRAGFNQPSFQPRVERGGFRPRFNIDYSNYRTPSGKFYCPMCNVTLNTDVQFGQHCQSKMHRQKNLDKKYQEMNM